MSCRDDVCVVESRFVLWKRGFVEVLYSRDEVCIVKTR